LQALLDINTDRGTAPPNAHDKIRAETALVYFHRQAVRIVEQGLLIDELLLSGLIHGHGLFLYNFKLR
jgi:hypothetical protein